jgi:hypothetical protein
MSETSHREPYANPRYYESVSIAAFAQSPESSLAGNITVSAETKVCDTDLDYSSPIVQLILLDPERFIGLCRELPAFVRDCVCQFHFLGRITPQIGEVLGANQRFVKEALQLADKAIIALACGVEPEGIDKVWAEMRKLDHQRRRDIGLLKLRAPAILGHFVIKIDDEVFPQFFDMAREKKAPVFRSM